MPVSYIPRAQEGATAGIDPTSLEALLASISGGAGADPQLADDRDYLVALLRLAADMGGSQAGQGTPAIEATPVMGPLATILQEQTTRADMLRNSYPADANYALGMEPGGLYDQMFDAINPGRGTMGPRPQVARGLNRTPLDDLGAGQGFDNALAMSNRAVESAPRFGGQPAILGQTPEDNPIMGLVQQLLEQQLSGRDVSATPSSTPTGLTGSPALEGDRTRYTNPMDYQSAEEFPPAMGPEQSKGVDKLLAEMTNRAPAVADAKVNTNNLRTLEQERGLQDRNSWMRNSGPVAAPAGGPGAADFTEPRSSAAEALLRLMSLSGASQAADITQADPPMGDVATTPIKGGTYYTRKANKKNFTSTAEASR